jgi:hypothetical protein
MLLQLPVVAVVPLADTIAALEARLAWDELTVKASTDDAEDTSRGCRRAHSAPHTKSKHRGIYLRARAAIQMEEEGKQVFCAATTRQHRTIG